MSAIAIKKYANRRLYNTLSKKYITLEELADLVRDGEEVEVIDNQTKKNITQEILLQVILNDEKKENVFSTKLLHQLIRLQRDQYQEFLQFYLSASLDSYIQWKGNLGQQFQTWSTLFNPMQNMMSIPPIQNTLQQTLQEYEKKIAELEKQLKGKEK